MRRKRWAWGRFAAVLVPSLLALVVLAVGMAEGTVPASFAVSGRKMKLSADELSGQGFGLTPETVRSVDGTTHSVTMLTMRSARIQGLCQSAVVNTPLGRYVIRLKARDPELPSHADDLQISATNIDADVDFGSLVLNQAAGTVKAVRSTGRPGDDYGLGALTFTVRDVRADAWLLTAGSFRVNGLNVSIGRDIPECF